MVLISTLYPALTGAAGISATNWSDDNWAGKTGMLRWSRQMPARLLILIALLAGAAPAQTSPSPLFSQVDEMLKGLSEITGWKVQRNVPLFTFWRYMENTISTGLRKTKMIRASGILRRMFAAADSDHR